MTSDTATDADLRSAAAEDALSTRPEDFIDIGLLLPGARYDIRYFTGDNFVGRRIDGYGAPICYLTRPAADALQGVSVRAHAEGLGLLIFDCYRPARAVAHFARWAADLEDQARKAAYYPHLAKQDLFKEGYIAARSGHSRGSTLDLTLFDIATGAELDMGTPFDLFDARSWTESPAVSPAQRANREKLKSLMGSGGFVGFHMEWWHFTLRGEPYPDTYFDFEIR